MAAWPAMAATAEGKTSMRPHCLDWMSAVELVVLEAIRSLMVQFGSASSTRSVPGGLTPSRKVPRGQTVRNLWQDAAVRTSRQSRQEPGEPEVRAQPADGPRDGRRTHVSGQGVHPLPEDVLGLATSRYARGGDWVSSAIAAWALRRIW